MQEEQTLVLRKKKKTRAPAKAENGEVETEQSKDTVDELRQQKSDISLPESISSRNMQPVTTEYSHDSDIMSHLFDDTDIDSDSSTTETEGSEVVQVMDSMYVNMLEVYDGLPEIEEISEDLESRKSVPIIVESAHSDQGAFVDPLTGEKLQKSDERIPSLVEPETIEYEDDEGEEETESSVELQVEKSMSEDSEILQLLELEKMEKEVLAKEALKADALDDFLMRKTISIEDTSNLFVLKVEQLEREKLYRILMTEAENFLHTIIEEVVEFVEYRQPKEILRNNLDKHFVMEEILTKINDLEVERTLRAVLNRRAIEFYKRKGLYLAITDDSPDKIMENMERLNYATSQLDRALGLERAMKIKYEFEQNQLNEKLERMQENAEQKEEELKTLILKSLVKRKGDSLTAISGLLNEMSTTYNEVCKTYRDLVQVQHTKTELQKKHDYIEYGKGLQKYVILQTETKDLHKKVEDRSVELGIVRARCNRDIHALSNIKVKGDIVRIINGMKKKTLACLLADRKESRAKLVHLKEERQYLQKQIRELTFQTGLLSKPVLLKDYDTTVEQAQTTAQNIAALRKHQRELVEKINQIEASYKAREMHG